VRKTLDTTEVSRRRKPPLDCFKKIADYAGNSISCPIPHNVLARPKQKKPRGFAAGLFLKDCEEDVPFLADLAATYSSKS
jgi:hypothetical protein